MITRYEKTRIMHRAVAHRDIIYLGGIVADDASAGMAEQTRQVCRKIETLLTGLGSDKSKLISVQLFITDMKAKDEMNKAWLDWLEADCLPARATIGVADLGKGNLIEAVVIATA